MWKDTPLATRHWLFAEHLLLDLKVCDPAMGSGAFLVEACRQLGDALVEAWHAHGEVPSVPPDEDEVIFARRLIAQRCLYGVDKNPVAVDLAKVSLWLVTLAKDHAFTFLNHALRNGDSLVGLTRDQIAAFHWEPKKQLDFVRNVVGQRLKDAGELRAKIQAAGDDVSEKELSLLLKDADEALDDVRRVGDLVTGAFFQGEKTKERETRRDELAEKVRKWLATREGNDELFHLAREPREWTRPVAPFHWEIEFPEVFGPACAGRRENPGFDAMVGNPPFAGKNTLINSHADGYPDWIKQIHEESHGNSDLVAHFFRRAFGLIRENGCFGLIATNTIAQGDTRATGLRWICTHGGTIFAARRRLKWPGMAAVVVSVVHVARKANGEWRMASGREPGHSPLTATLDGRRVEKITAFLFDRGGHEDPAVLRANEGKSFVGSYVLGMGFTFDDTDKNGVASPLAEMHRLIAKDRRNAERIFPYIGGEEVNTSPTHAHHRYVINFGEMSEAEARKWPDLMAIVEAKVKPERLKNKRDVRKKYWWRFGETTPALFAAIRNMERVLVISRVGQQGAFAFLPAGVVYAESLVVFAFGRHEAFCILQSRVHELWVRFFASSLEDRLRYTPSDCFETFPFPWASGEWRIANGGKTDDHSLLATRYSPLLEAAGRAYYEFRAALMVRNDEGLTKTYNRFHDPDERDPEIAKLRKLHAAVDRAVLDAYGWNDIPTDCEFLLDYEEEEANGEWRVANGGKTDEHSPLTTRCSPPGGSRRRPWRYRWPDEGRDEVLARLLELNAERAKEEARSGAAAAAAGKGKHAKPARKGRRKAGAIGDLFE